VNWIPDLVNILPHGQVLNDKLRLSRIPSLR
jgi:hypothetical protein